ncbi:MAG: dienelactone hydrolase family protein [Burkholderiales bacterium]|jgi:carboxymethylenebutenolidase|nr:dienelactone hydrolase family protein [Burkholderiales bacterium]HAT51897.1 carboxymethylenebutenolidase [Betaproteobacteria bacterium]
MTGQWIQVEAKDGDSFSGYLALPKNGKGPGIVLCQEIFGVNAYIQSVADHYAEEGYVVLAPDLFWRIEPGIQLGYTEKDFGRAFDLFGQFDTDKGMEDITECVKALRNRSEVIGKVGALGFCLGGRLAYLAAARSGVDCAVAYYGVTIDDYLVEAKDISIPIALHFAEDDQYAPPETVAKIQGALKEHENTDIHVYPGVDHGFSRTGSSHFHRTTADLAHQRSISLFRKSMGPHYDFSDLWDKHCEYEFGTRDVDATMATMVSEPYVNHIPTMTGGVGQIDLKRFYQHHFIPKTPKDTMLIPVSRTVGEGILVDEMVFCFTHDIEIDWMLPGIQPTGKRVEIPLVAIVKFRGDKLHNEHIYWDQASVLVQIGLLDPAGLPIAGIEATHKLLDAQLPSNQLMGKWTESGNG